jgi:uncharacterized phage protein (TIGR01671 family)
MNDQPEFRAWNNIDKVMVGWDYFEKCPEEFVGQPEELEIMQYTGKKDANGTKIFASDIIEYFGIRKIVGWNNELSMWGLKRSIDGKFHEQFATVDLEKSVVIGNTFQNSKLLEQ